MVAICEIQYIVFESMPGYTLDLTHSFSYFFDAINV